MFILEEHKKKHSFRADDDEWKRLVVGVGVREVLKLHREFVKAGGGSLEE